MNDNINSMWVEKYRPKTLDDIIGQQETVERLKAYVRAGNLPHVLFAGVPGTGKTTAALALAFEIYGKDWRQNILECNASDDRGIDVVRGKIKDFARTSPIGGVPFKLIFLDEADALTRDAQAALRRTMETQSNTTRFILSCNYSSKIIEPIQSRCAVFRFGALHDEDIRAMITKIVANENIAIEDSGYDAIVGVANGDMRRAINALQMASMSGKPVTAEVVGETTATASTDEMQQLIMYAMMKQFKEARVLLDELLIKRGMSGSDVVIGIHRGIMAAAETLEPGSMRTNMLGDIMMKLADADYRISEGANARIQIEAVLAYMGTL